MSTFMECDLSLSILTESNFEGAILKSCKLDKSILIGSTFNEKTVFPQGFDPIRHGMVPTSKESLLEKSKTRKKVLSQRALAQEFRPKKDFSSQSQEAKQVLILSPVENQIQSDYFDRNNKALATNKPYYFRGRLVED